MSYLYYPTGEKTNMAEFISFYSKGYYLTVNHEVEDMIIALIGKNKYSDIDVFHIIAWKTDSILQFKSKKDDLKYKDGWDEKTLTANIYGFILNVEELTKTINNTPATQEAFLNNVATCNVLTKEGESKMFGNVYAITFLYFKSGGYFPIYDSFAQKALKAISMKKVPPYHIPATQYNSSSFAVVYSKYVSEIYRLFPSFSKDHRRIDQALWMYGHLFK